MSLLVDETKYPNFASFAKVFELSPRKIVGRDKEVRALQANLARPEMSSIALLGEAGVGKTALVELLAHQDKKSDYFEVDLARMGADGPQRMAARMKGLVDEVRGYQVDSGRPVVLFMDEFHQIVQLSPAATEAIKPILARSGQFNIKIIVATTFEEYVENIAGNEALSERLQRLTVDAPPDSQIVAMLRDMVSNYAPDAIVRPSLYENIISVSNRYMPSEHQPRKSLKILDAMLGYYRAFDVPLNTDLLNTVIYESAHVNTQWHVDINKMRSYLHSRVLGQDGAVDIILDRLQLSVADLADETRPQASMVFTGSTGTGKTELAKSMAYSLFGTEEALIRFDMSEFSKDDSVDDFREKISDAIREQPYAIVLLDEIEKASRKVSLLLLQLLDDGRLSDRYGRQVTFTNAYIILTTNLGAEVYEDVQKFDTNVREYIPLIREALTRENNGFPPELIGRLDEIVPFNPLTVDVLKKIARIQLASFKKLVNKKHSVIVHYDIDIIDYLVEEHFDTSTNSGGGRALSQRISREIRAKVARTINENMDLTDVKVLVKGSWSRGPKGNKHDLVGTAEVVVQPG